jgi:hypothetical protein
MYCKFESLEGRQMMSATAGDLVDELCPINQPAPVTMALRSEPPMMAAKAPSSGVNIQNMVGKYKKGTSLFFSSTMQIKSVSPDGKTIVGKVNIPWLATCSIRGSIDKATGRFTLRFTETTEDAKSRMNGYFKGKMHPSGKYLQGTFKYYYGTDTSSGAKPYEAKYVRQ